jgi:hypothetical protein
MIRQPDEVCCAQTAAHSQAYELCIFSTNCCNDCTMQSKIVRTDTGQHSTGRIINVGRASTLNYMM